MMRKLLATTAAAALLASVTPAIAADNSDTSTTFDMQGTSIFQPDDTMKANVDANGYVTARGSEILASNLLGKPVYSGDGKDAKTIGDVNDVLMSPSGDAEAIVVGVGGFLGIGEKEVAVDFSKVHWSDPQQNGARLVVSATADELRNAPAFDRLAVNPNGIGGVDNSDPTSGMDGAKQSLNDTMTGGSVASNDQMMNPDSLSADDLIGTPVYDGNNNDMGEVSDVILSADSKEIEAYIVDIGGFLGVGEKPVALATDRLQVAEAENGSLSIHTKLTQEQLENGPTYSATEYARNPESVLVR